MKKCKSGKHTYPDADKSCIECKRESDRTRIRKYRAADLEKYKAQKKAYCRANPEKVKAQKKAYRAGHRDEIAAKYAAYWAENQKELVEKQAKRHAKGRAKAIAYLGGRCVRCGATEGLDFDHLDGATKSFTIGERLKGRWSIIEAELSKCQLLCRDCHIQKTALKYPQIAKALHVSPRGGTTFKNSTTEVSYANH
jgi:hypothetical protein